MFPVTAIRRGSTRTGVSGTESSRRSATRTRIRRRWRWSDAIRSGLAFQWFYTFTRSLTTTDSGASTNGNGSINDTSGQALVPENIQLLGEPSLTLDQRLWLVYYNSTAIPPHHIRFNGIYDLPFGKAKHFG